MHQQPVGKQVFRERLGNLVRRFMRYCTYAYLREDGTPYYIGKGTKHRPYSKNRLFKPPSKDRILILKQNLTEEEAFKHEIYMITTLGRKDLGTGILRNLTNGGEGTSGWVPSEETKRKQSDSNKGRVKTPEEMQKIAESVAGYSWYNNGEENMQAREHPGEGWAKGRLLDWQTPRNSGMRWYHRDGERKMFKDDPGEGWVLGVTGRDYSNNHTNKGKKWYNNGQHNRMFVDPPDGWVPGMIRKRHG